STVRLQRVVHANGEHIRLPQFQMRREIVFETDVPKRTMAERLTVDPHIAVHVNAVELDEHLFVPPRLRRDESASIRANARRQITAAAARGCGLIVWPFDAPIVREIECAPR